MARRGFFAELQHQSRVAALERARADQEAARRRAAAARQAEQARKAAERTRTVLAKSADAERKRLERESHESYVAAKEAEVAEKNDELAQINQEISSLLAAALKVDAYVDLASLRVEATHPPFNGGDLEVPIPMPHWIPDPSEPVMAQIEPPSGLAKLFGRKKYEEAANNAQRIHDQALITWRSDCQAIRARRQKAVESHAVAEVARLEALKSEQERYANECAVRESEAATHNKRLGELIANLGYGTADAIQEYVEIVLSNSAYPDHFQVLFESDFDPSTAELRLRVLVPGPTAISEVKSFKYAKVGGVNYLGRSASIILAGSGVVIG